MAAHSSSLVSRLGGVVCHELNFLLITVNVYTLVRMEAEERRGRFFFLWSSVTQSPGSGVLMGGNQEVHGPR